MFQHAVLLHGVVADVARFTHPVLDEFALHAEAPLEHVRRLQVLVVTSSSDVAPPRFSQLAICETGKSANRPVGQSAM